MKKPHLPRIALLLLLFVAAQTMATAQLQKEKLVQLLYADASASEIADIPPSLLAQNFKKFGCTDSVADALASRYAKEQLNADFADITYPIFAETLTDADVDYLIAAYNNPEIRTILQNLRKNIGNITKGVREAIMPVVSSVLTGEKPEKVKLKPEITETYAAKYKHFTALTGIDGLMNAYIGQVKTALGDLAKKGTDKEELDVIDSLLSALEESMPTIMVNSSTDIMTEKELDKTIEIYSQPSAQKFSKVMVSAMSNPLDLYGKLVEKQMSWLTTQKF